MFLDILMYLILGAFGIVLWGICGLFVCAMFRNLKPMPKHPEFKTIPIYPEAGLSINEYRDKLGYKPAPEVPDMEMREYTPKEFDAVLYDQEKNPWNERDISAKGQNNV